MSKINEYVSEAVRKQVALRADFRCEYCLIHERDTYFGCEIDHITSVKHGGGSEPENLAYACMVCNRFKGSDLGSLTDEGALIRFFNPRIDIWSAHFRIHHEEIFSITEIGAVTVHIFRFNEVERKVERLELKKLDITQPSD